MKQFLIAAVISCSVGSAAFVNGDFSSGSTGWTTQQQTNATAAFSVVNFDTTGSGASSAMQATMGSLVAGERRGGSIQQTLTLGPGSYTITADIASFYGGGFLQTLLDLGLVEMTADGVVLDSHDFGSVQTIVPAPITTSGNLNSTGLITITLVPSDPITRRAQLSGNLNVAAQKDVVFGFNFLLSNFGNTTIAFVPVTPIFDFVLPPPPGSFLDLGTPVNQYIDNITITENVPEPATFGLMVSCVAAFLLHRRRK